MQMPSHRQGCAQNRIHQRQTQQQEERQIVPEQPDIERCEGAIDTDEQRQYGARVAQLRRRAGATKVPFLRTVVKIRDEFPDRAGVR